MTNQKNPGNNPQQNSNEGSGKANEQKGSEKNSDMKATNHDPKKNPDPTTPERKNNPDPTKPEKQEGPYADDSKQKEARQDNTVWQPKNPAKVESNSDEDIGTLEEQDIDDQGITGERKDDDGGEDDADERSRRKAS